MDFVRSHLGMLIWKKSEPKVFNWSEFHLSEVTFYEIHILVKYNRHALEFRKLKKSLVDVER